MEQQIQDTPQWRTSLCGAWMLDTARSDTMRRYLECLQIPAPAIEVQVAGEMSFGSLNVIDIDGGTVKIHKQTKINDFTERFELNQEKVTTTRHGARRCTVSLGGWGDGESRIVSSIYAPTPGGQVHMVETRELLEGGMAHAQEIRMHNHTTGGQDLTLRMWNRIPMTNEHLAALGQA